MFDFSQDDEKAGGGPLPDGDYQVVLKSIEDKQSDFVAGERFFNCDFEVVAGPHAGRHVFANWTYQSPDQQKDLKIPRGRIKALALATVQKPAFQSVAELNGKVCDVRVKNNDGKKRDGTVKTFTNITNIAAPGQLSQQSANTAPPAQAGYTTQQQRPWP